MNERFSPDVVSGQSDLGERPGRSQAAADAMAMDLPTTETEEWRYSPISDADFSQLMADLSPVLAAPDAGLVDAALGAADNVTSRVEAAAAKIVVVDGFAVQVDVDPGWAAKGLTVEVDGARTLVSPPSPTLFDSLHHAFSPAAVVVSAPAGLAVTEPVLVVTYHGSPSTLSCPHVVINVAEAGELSVVELQTSAPGAGLQLPVTELYAGPASRLRYAVLQENGADHVQIGRQVSSADGQASLAAGVAAFGGRYLRLRTDSRLVGRGATASLAAAYYGDGDQVHDFRTFQHHEARDTKSDLLFKGTQDDRSGSIYTGLIHIHADGAGTNAFQTNRNVKLSEDAWAWSVPNLEIENNEVHCSHASTVSPVDDDQRFYLHARGVPPTAADRLIVAGFYDEVLARLPVEVVRDRVKELINEKLDRRSVNPEAASGQIEGAQ